MLVDSYGLPHLIFPKSPFRRWHSLYLTNQKMALGGLAICPKDTAGQRWAQNLRPSSSATAYPSSWPFQTRRPGRQARGTPNPGALSAAPAVRNACSHYLLNETGQAGRAGTDLQRAPADPSSEAPGCARAAARSPLPAILSLPERRRPRPTSHRASRGQLPSR